MKRMTLSEYLAVPENYRGVWTTERWDIPDWENLRKKHMGKRTLMVYDRGTCLLEITGEYGLPNGGTFPIGKT